MTDLRFYDGWSKLLPGQAFQVKTARSKTYVKLDYDPFSAPIGPDGCCCVDGGSTHVITELVDLTRPMADQIELVDLLPHSEI